MGKISRTYFSWSTGKDASLALPLTTIELPEQPTMDVYDQKMAESLAALQADGFTHCGYGDIFLEDLKAYRDGQMAPYGI